MGAVLKFVGRIFGWIRAVDWLQDKTGWGRFVAPIMTAGLWLGSFLYGLPWPLQALIGLGAGAITLIVLNEASDYWVRRSRRRSRLSLVFEPQGANGRLYDSLHHEGSLRIIRVGVMKSGEAAVRNAAVIMSGLEPSQEHIFNMQELQQTHFPDGTSRFDVNPSREPLVFVDLIWQEIDEASGATVHLAIAFSRGKRELSPAHDQYSIRLAIDGGGDIYRRDFVLRKNRAGQYDLEAGHEPD
jgi:hypothetical protein